MDNKHLWVAIIAGGKGTRLFPISHPARPKQFCRLDENNTFIQAVVDNFISIGIKATQILIITTDDNQRQLAKDQCLPKGVISPNIVKLSPMLGYAGCMWKPPTLLLILTARQSSLIRRPTNISIQTTAFILLLKMPFLQPRMVTP